MRFSKAAVIIMLPLALAMPVVHTRNEIDNFLNSAPDMGSAAGSQAGRFLGQEVQEKGEGMENGFEEKLGGMGGGMEKEIEEKLRGMEKGIEEKLGGLFGFMNGGGKI